MDAVDGTQLCSDVRIEHASPGSESLRQVIALGDRNARFLGHFPEAAYQREAGRRRIITALDEQRTVLGYVLFRTTRDRAVVQHLCVDDHYRGTGVGKLLIEELKRQTSHLACIVCHCAREFTNALAAWQRFGFVPLGEKPGRGLNRRPLIRLVFDHGHHHLFSGIEASLASETIVAVMDLNVALEVLDLRGLPSDDPEIGALRGDWLQEEVSLWVTDESLVEVTRQVDDAERRRRQAQLRGIPAVSRSHSDESRIYSEVVSFMGAPKRPQDESDRRHIAMAIAGEADVFLTRDEGILTFAAAIEDAFGLQVLRPSELVLRLDEVARRGDYVPMRLHGSAIEARLLRATDIDDAVAQFLNHAVGESRHQLREVLCGLAARPKESRVLLVSGEGTSFGALMAWEMGERGRSQISLLRVAPHKLAPTLTRHLVYLAVRQSLGANCSVLEITDRAASETVPDAANALGFVKSDHSLIKWSSRGVQDAETLAREMGLLAASGAPCAVLEALVQTCRGNEPSAFEQAVLERRIWPGILAESRLPTYVVPIQPRWARDLFDAGLGSELLFGGNPALLLNCENVYYRSSHVPVVRAPSRVLWYVSSKGADVVRQLRGYSAVVETEVGTARDLFRKYRRLGVYEWGDIAEMTDGDPLADVMAIRFGPTECFPKPMPGPMLRELIGRHRNAGVPPLTMPIEVPAPCLHEILRYCYGT